MTHVYSIRNGRLADLPLLGGIEVAAATLFPESDLPAPLRHMATEQKIFRAAVVAERLWVACDAADNVVGFVLADEVGGLAYLEEIDVHPGHMRRGIGRRLIARVIQWAEQHGYSALRLVTFAHLPWNAPYYAAQGFVVLDNARIGEDYQQLIDEDAAVGIDPARRVVMELRLPSGEQR